MTKLKKHFSEFSNNFTSALKKEKMGNASYRVDDLESVVESFKLSEFNPENGFHQITSNVKQLIQVVDFLHHSTQDLRF